MNQEQINVTGMHSTVASFMNQNKAVWTANAAITSTLTQLGANNDVIAQKRDVQETSTEGQTALALQAKISLEEKIVEVADQIFALATRNNDVAMQAQSHFTLSGFFNWDPNKVVQTGKDISALATTNLAALADYGVTQADLTELDTLTKNFDKLKFALRTAVSKQAAQTATLPQAILSNQTLLRLQLDKQMTKFRKTNPEFYAGYHAARVTINRRSHHTGKQPAPVPQTGTAK